MERQRSLYGKHWEHYCAMRPGITGLWQVSGRNRLSYARRVELDAEYVSNWSLWFDIKILFKTVRTVITSEGSR
jgi:lipopolysaccharide/colanic/teichoic acid biosynthesis glycosyltransferase